eukprot:429683_1
MATFGCVLCVAILICTTCNSVITPTVTNSSGEYYINPQSTTSKYWTIKCTNPNCIILCDLIHQCYRGTINASLSATLTLTCSNDFETCRYINLINGPSTLSQISCLGTYGHSSCDDASFNVENTTNVNFLCEYTHRATINAQYANTVNIQGNIRYSIINVNNTNTTMINTNGDSYIDVGGSYIYGSCISTELSIRINTYGDASLFTTIYCPLEAKCTVNCTSNRVACQNYHLYIKSETSSYFNLYCDNEHWINSNSPPCVGILFNCIDTGLSSVVSYDPTNYEYECFNECCPPIRTQSTATTLMPTFASPSPTIINSMCAQTPLPTTSYQTASYQTTSSNNDNRTGELLTLYIIIAVLICILILLLLYIIKRKWFHNETELKKHKNLNVQMQQRILPNDESIDIEN